MTSETVDPRSDAVDRAPSFFAPDFHTKFFPRLLRYRLRRRETPRPFGAPIEYHVVVVVAGVAAVLGLPAAARGSLAGGVFGGMGAAVLLLLGMMSLRSSLKFRPGWQEFLPAVFFFFVMLGLTAGLYWASLHHSRWLGLLASATGILAGYVAGIVAGLWIPYLGLIAALFDGLATLAVVGMLVLDVLLIINL